MVGMARATPHLGPPYRILADSTGGLRRPQHVLFRSAIVPPCPRAAENEPALLHDLPVRVLARRHAVAKRVEVAAPDLQLLPLARGARQGPLRDAGVAVHEVLVAAIVDVGDAGETHCQSLANLRLALEA